MSEEIEAASDGPEGPSAAVDPVAVALALGGASQAQADAFLKKQGRLADLQHEVLADKEAFELSHMRWRRFTDQMKGVLQVMTAIVGLAAATGVSLMIWDAAHSNGLVIEPFAVPTDMAAKGITGQMVASQMLDKLTAMQAATDSARPAQSYANNWGDNLKVEIPETGVSIGELQQFLKGWLGHDTHITGEVWHTPNGIAVSARTGAETGASFSGPESELDGLMQKAAEHVYGITQPYRYANFLDRAYNAPDIADRAARAAVIYRKLIAGPSTQERAWAWNGLGTIELRVKRDSVMAYIYYQKAIAADPEFTLGYFALGSFSQVDSEKRLAFGLKAKALLDRGSHSGVSPDQLPLRRLYNDGDIAEDKGDYGAAFRDFKAAADLPQNVASLSRANALANSIVELAYLHIGGGLRGYLREVGIFSMPRYPDLARALEDWPALLKMEKSLPVADVQRIYRGTPQRRADFALAHAHTGDFAGAQVLIAPSPPDCDDCGIARGQIAEMQGQHTHADAWFAQVEKAQPSIPFADAAWGEALLQRGDADGAIAKFALANQKGPHFADPLEGWGEALMAKNQSHLALAKFVEAEKYAPNWGRLHLKWGEALIYAGKRDEAKVQFARAAQLDLAPTEKAELARH